MKTKKKEVSHLIESLGNEPGQNNHANSSEWFRTNNPMEGVSEPQKPNSKPGCKSGNCGNNKTAMTIGFVVLGLTLFAGYGLGKLIEFLF